MKFIYCSFVVAYSFIIGGSAERLQCYGCFAGMKNQSHAPDCPAQFGEEEQFPCSEQESHCMTMRGRVDGGMVDLYGCGGERMIPNTTETYCHRHGNGCHEEADLTMPPHLGGKNVTDVSICCCDQDLCNSQGWFNMAECVGVSRVALCLLLLSAILNN